MEPCIVEIVGLAGAGKTTLFHLIKQMNGSFQTENFPNVRNILHLPFFASNALRMGPAILRMSRHNSRNITLRELAWLSILRGWPALLQKKLQENKSVVLDQGPVYLLTETREFGPKFLGMQNADKFWNDLYVRWNDTLNVIVWLDADAPVLMDRIRRREKEHVVKHESDETMLMFLARYRRAYERTISTLIAGHHNLKILRYDTSDQPAEEILDKLLLELGFPPL